MCNMKIWTESQFNKDFEAVYGQRKHGHVTVRNQKGTCGQNSIGRKPKGEKHHSLISAGCVYRSTPVPTIAEDIMVHNPTG